jgi:uncharacterized protein YndB with AHSA1/START domain
MLSENTFGVKLISPTFVITQFLRAPRDVVFDAVVEPEYLARWMGPSDFRQEICEVELWRGGAYRSVLRASDGKELTFRGVYREVIRPERLVYTERFDVEPHSSHEHVVSITLAERAGATALTLTERLRSVKERRAKMKVGAWEANLQSMDRLAELVESIGAANAQDDRDRALVPFECDDAVEPYDRLTGRGRALERFAELFGARL